jgi:hypothetical protein
MIDESSEASIVRIEAWAIVHCDEGRALVGRVFGHRRIDNGHWTVTSLLVGLGPELAVTQNTIYALGRPLSCPLPAHVTQALRDRDFELPC